MAQRQPASVDVTEEARRKQLLSDPNVIVHHGTGIPFAQEQWAKEGVDVLWLIGRTDDDDDDEQQGGDR